MLRLVDSFMRLSNQSGSVSSPTAGRPLLTFLQHLCVDCVEKAEWRTQTADSVIAILLKIHAKQVGADAGRVLEVDLWGLNEARICSVGNRTL